MINNGYNFYGMHLIWWFIWFVMMLWIFATPLYVPFQDKKRDSPLDILKKRFASGHISKEEYQDQKSILETK